MSTQTATGTELPPWELPVTPTLVVSTALATRDFQDVHHDRDLAQGHGSQDIFLNILTTTGLVQRYVGEWARDALGDGFVIRSCGLRLGAPAYPYDTVRFTATVTAEADGVLTLAVVGEVLTDGPTNGMHHVDAKVVVAP
jgi:acyl dehydratase